MIIAIPGKSNRWRTFVKYIPVSVTCAPLMLFVWILRSVGAGGGVGAGAAFFSAGGAGLVLGAGPILGGAGFGFDVCAAARSVTDEARAQLSSARLIVLEVTIPPLPRALRLARRPG